MPHPTTTLEEEMFEREVANQCGFAIEFYEDMKRAPNAFTCFRFVQGFLSAVANVSKLLWPTCGNVDRGKRLRDALGVSDSCPLRSRDLRNSYDHFDERLDEWATLHTTVVDMNVGSTEFIVGPPDKAFLRNFDAPNGELTFWNQTFPLAPLVAELHRIEDEVARHGVILLRRLRIGAGFAPRH